MRESVFAKTPLWKAAVWLETDGILPGATRY